MVIGISLGITAKSSGGGGVAPPDYEITDGTGSIVDNGDGTSTVTVTGGTFDGSVFATVPNASIIAGFPIWLAANEVESPVGTFTMEDLWMYPVLDVPLFSQEWYRGISPTTLIGTGPAYTLVGADTDEQVAWVVSAKNSTPLVVAPEQIVQDEAAPVDYMGDNVDKLYWFEPSEIVETAGTVTSWPDKTGNGYGIAQLGSTPMPTYTSTEGGFATFDGTQVIGAAITDTGISKVLLDGGEVTLFMVHRQPDLGATIAPTTMYIEGPDTGVLQSHFVAPQELGGQTYFEVRGNGASTCYRANLGTTSQLGNVIILEWTITQTDADWYIDGVFKKNATVTPAQFPTSALKFLVLGGKGNASSTSAYWKGDVFELYATANLDPTLNGNIRQQLATKHGITL